MRYRVCVTSEDWDFWRWVLKKMLCVVWEQLACVCGVNLYINIL